jgi:exodeoxyribonuclease V alpha subunit
MSTSVAFVPDASQKHAIELIQRARFALITGGPGTGKTTIMGQAIAGFEPASVLLAAPTGKAARRMASASKREASTVHRMLGFHGDGFDHDQNNPLEAELVIVDEASMLDIQLAAALFNAIGPRTRLILIGDANQLPSVGPGRVFADLLEHDAIPQARLTKVHRSTEVWVNRNAPNVLAGKALELEPAHDFEFVEVNDAVGVPAAVREVVSRDDRAYVLSPQRTGHAGVYRLNAELQALRNPDALTAGADAPKLRREHYTMYVDDVVIQTKNDYSRGVTNGEIGTLETINGGACTAIFGDARVAYTNEQAFALELAYALTIHKSQGSEYDHVVVVCHSTHTRMLTRKLLYTAITRTRRKVTLVGDRKGIGTALRTARDDKRNTSLLERLRGELEPMSEIAG